MPEETTKIFPSKENISLLQDNAAGLSEGKLKDALLGLSKAELNGYIIIMIYRN
jgi:hypothetical protein